MQRLEDVQDFTCSFKKSIPHPINRNVSRYYYIHIHITSVSSRCVQLLLIYTIYLKISQVSSSSSNIRRKIADPPLSPFSDYTRSDLVECVLINHVDNSDSIASRVIQLLILHIIITFIHHPASRLYISPSCQRFPLSLRTSSPKLCLGAATTANHGKAHNTRHFLHFLQINLINSVCL